jgi:hypothetical protein
MNHCEKGVQHQLRASGNARRHTEPQRAEAFFLCERRGGGFSMFAPPICRRRWRNNAFSFWQLR